MPILFYVILVWLKIIICTSLIFLWLWVARDRGYTGVKLLAHTLGALTLWAAPWIVFFIMQADLYQGRCGLRQGIRDCGVIFMFARARVSRGTNSGALGLR